MNKLSEIMTYNNNDKKELSLFKENSMNGNRATYQNNNHMLSIMKMIDNSQSELLQAQIDLQNGQHQIRKLETILQIFNGNNSEKVQFGSYCNNSQSIKNEETTKIMDLKSEILLVQKDNKNVKKHLESVFLTNSQLQNGIEMIKNEIKKKDHLLQLSNQENKEKEMEKKALETTISNLHSEIDKMKTKFKEKLNTLKNKLRSYELMESKFVVENEELLRKLNEYELKIDEYEKQILKNKEKYNLIDIQNNNTKQNFYDEMQNYEEKVKEIIEEMKMQKEKLENESNKLLRELKASKKAAIDTNENYKQVLQKLDFKDQEIQQLKYKLTEKCELEERDKLLKRELDDRIFQIQNYKSQIMELGLEKEKYVNRNHDQDIAIRHLLDEIKSLHNQLKMIKQQTDNQNMWNESICSTSNIAIPNISTPQSQATTEFVNGQSQSMVHYSTNINNGTKNNSGKNQNYKIEEIEISNNSESESGDENTIKKIANRLKNDNCDCTKICRNSYEIENSIIKIKDVKKTLVADDFTRYLEEQLQLIKIAGERNLASIKRELTAK